MCSSFTAKFPVLAQSYLNAEAPYGTLTIKDFKLLQKSCKDFELFYFNGQYKDDRRAKNVNFKHEIANFLSAN